MTEWRFASEDPADELAILHQFSMKKREPGGDVEFIITVKEFARPRDPTMLFFALADKQVLQRDVPYTPCGWGTTLLKALAECVIAIKQFPCQGAQE
jgi:hypothetical protein